MLKKMRQCRLNFADNRYDCEAGIIGEHYATELIVTPPAIMPTEAVYRLCFEPGGLSEIILQTTDGAFSYPLPSAVTATPYCCVTLIGYVGSEQIYKSRMVRLHFSQTADGDSSIDLQQPGIVDEVNRNTAARHGHDNKSVIDLLTADDTGTLLYNGKTVTGASDLTIGMTVEGDGEKFKVTSCDATIEQIDDALVSGQRIAVVVTGENAKFLLPMLQGTQGEAYYFGSFLLGQTAAAYVLKDTSSGISTWTFGMYQIEAESVDYSNAALPNISTVRRALDELVTKSPTYYIDLAGKYPNYTCPVAMDDIKAAYDSGYNLVCRCKMGAYTATLPLFVPMPAANTWIFSGSGCLQSMKFEAQSFTVAITANGVVAQNKELVTFGGTLPNPYELQITVGNTAYLYDGSERVNIVIDDGTEVSY